MISWPTTVKTFSVEDYPCFFYAQWRHPLERDKVFDKALLDCYAGIIKPGDNVLDIGAHTGDTSVLFAVLAGKAGGVTAIEPNPAVFEVLKLNSVLNKNLAPITPHCLAIMPEDREYEFNYTDPGCCNGGYADVLCASALRYLGETRVTVQGSTGDFLSKSLFDFIKIDTEGSDLMVLKTLPVKAAITQVEFFPGLTLDQKMELYRYLADDCLIYPVGGDTLVDEDYVASHTACWDAICFRK